MALLKNNFSQNPPLWAKKSLRVVRGLAQDFWNDGNWKSGGVPVFPKVQIEIDPPPYMSTEEAKQWLGDVTHMREIMWGAGCVLPSDIHLVDAMVLPLGLSKDTTVLDMSAGLGYIGRYMSERFGNYVDGLEADALTAERGMELSTRAGMARRASVQFYDPDKFTKERNYSCVFMRELLYKIKDKKKFIKEIGKTLKVNKPNAVCQLSMTDYVLEDTSRSHPAVVAWCEREKNVVPLSLETLKKMLATAGLDVRIADDITKEHLDGVRQGLKSLLSFLRVHTLGFSDVTLVKEEVDLWAARTAALENGLKLYRFYAIK